MNPPSQSTDLENLPKARFQRAAELFLRVRGLPLAERDEVLVDLCEGDLAIKAHVEALLEGAEQDLPFADLARQLAGGDSPELTADANGRIGPYRLLEKIGEGGFGSVFMAEQQEGIRRKVAVKVLRPGMDSKQVIARFEVERQALALMDHPCITRVLDAGTTPHGRPFFVMELVRGVPITTYCDRERLTTRQRVELLTAVCQAVHHAHQKGVIHRDLKPSNVLVTLLDGRPTPKVIDFGIAKATGPRLTDRTLFTEFRQLLGTPEYMSPEQAEMSSSDIDTRTDIWSLGVMLYELLTGTTPHDGRTLRKAAHGDMHRILREVDPPLPSRRLGQLPDADVNGNATTLDVAPPAPPPTPPGTTTVRSIAESRSTDPSGLRRQLRGELDWIVMKCLEKDRTRRYETANDLVLDLQRYLTDQPILAGPPSVVYRVRKLARRHRVLLSAVAAVLVALLAGLAATLWFLVEARTQRDRAMVAEKLATDEMGRAALTADVLRDLVRVAGPEQQRDQSYTVRELLQDFVKSLGDRLEGHPEVEATIRLTLGEAFIGVAEFAVAEQQLDQGLGLARAQPPGETLARLLEARGTLYSTLGAQDQALATFDEALALRKSLPGNQARATGVVLAEQARVQIRRHDFAAAERLATESVALLGGEHAAAAAPGLRMLAVALSGPGWSERAEQLQQRLVDLHRSQQEPDAVALAEVLADLALSRQQRGDYKGSELLMREALALQPKLARADPHVAAAALHNFAATLSVLGKLDEAETMYRDALARLTTVLGPDNTTVASSSANLAAVLIRRGDLDEAESRNLDAERILRAHLPECRLTLAGVVSNLGVILGQRQQFSAARARFEEGLQLLEQELGGEHVRVAMAHGNVARAASALGDTAAFVAQATQAVELHRALDGATAEATLEMQLGLAEGLTSQGDLDGAEAWVHEALAALEGSASGVRAPFVRLAHRIKSIRESGRPVERRKS